MKATVIMMMLGAYLCGSLSAAIIISRLLRLPNPLQHGSHNPGATNMLRLAGFWPGLLVLLIDMLKGALPVWFAYKLGVPPFYLGFVAIAATLGHIFPCWHHFQGGKGVATAFGTMAVIGWDFAGAFALTWLLVVLLSGYSSVGAIICFLLAPFYAWLFRPELTLPVAMLSCLILIRHSSNISRLLHGEEKRIWRSSR